VGACGRQEGIGLWLHYALCEEKQCGEYRTPRWREDNKEQTTLWRLSQVFVSVFYPVSAIAEIKPSVESS